MSPRNRRTTPREHGTHACYVFGTWGGDRANGCRCQECRNANKRYERDRARRTEPPYVGADTARQHIAWLATQGVGLKQVAKVSGVSHGALWKLIYGVPSAGRPPSKRIRPATSEAILAVMPSHGAAGSRVPAGPVWEDVERLLGRGWTKAAIARAIGQGGPGLQLGRQVVTRRNAEAIHALLEVPVPDDVGKAWSAHHRAGDILEVVDGVEELRDQARRAEATNRTRRHRMREDFEPVALDDADELILDMAKLLERRIDEAAWRAHAACRGRAAWMFFPGRGDVRTVAAARKVCGACLVREECLAANLHEQTGIYGGLTPRERRALRRGTAA